MELAPYALCLPVAAALAVDLVLYMRGGYKATISGWIASSSSRAGVAGFGLGALFGHLFLGGKR